VLIDDQIMDQLYKQQILKELGLSQEETHLYLTTLKHDPLSTTQLAKLTGIPKTTIYRYIESLREKNLVEKVIGPRGILIHAQDPEQFELILEEKKNNILKLNSSLPLLITDLKTIQPSINQKTEVRYYDGVKGIKQLLWNTLSAVHSEVVGYGYKSWNTYVGEKYAEKLREEYVLRKIFSKEILNHVDKKHSFTKNTPYLQKCYKNREISTKKLEINYNTIIYLNVFATYNVYGGEIFGIEIYNAEIAKSQRQIFYMLWEEARKPSP